MLFLGNFDVLFVSWIHEVAWILKGNFIKNNKVMMFDNIVEPCYKQVSLKVSNYGTSSACINARASAGSPDSVITFPEACDRCRHINCCSFLCICTISHLPELPQFHKNSYKKTDERIKFHL